MRERQRACERAPGREGERACSFRGPSVRSKYLYRYAYGCMRWQHLLFDSMQYRYRDDDVFRTSSFVLVEKFLAISLMVVAHLVLAVVRKARASIARGRSLSSRGVKHEERNEARRQTRHAPAHDLPTTYP